MRAVFIQNSGAELVSDDTSCISCAPMGAFSVAISDTHASLQIHGRRWRLSVIELAQFIKTFGDQQDETT